MLERTLAGSTISTSDSSSELAHDSAWIGEGQVFHSKLTAFYEGWGQECQSQKAAGSYQWHLKEG